GREGSYGYAYRVQEDGTGLRKAFDHPVIGTRAVSPDGRWLIVYSRPTEERTGGILAFPLSGGPPVRMFGPGLRVHWSADGRRLFLSFSSGTTYLLPVAPGHALPEVPEGGFRSHTEAAHLPGAQIVVTSVDAAPGPTPDVYAFSRETVQRNLYRV